MFLLELLAVFVGMMEKERRHCAETALELLRASPTTFIVTYASPNGTPETEKGSYYNDLTHD